MWRYAIVFVAAVYLLYSVYLIHRLMRGLDIFYLDISVADTISAGWFLSAYLVYFVSAFSTQWTHLLCVCCIIVDFATCCWDRFYMVSLPSLTIAQLLLPFRLLSNRDYCVGSWWGRVLTCASTIFCLHGVVALGLSFVGAWMFGILFVVFLGVGCGHLCRFLMAR